MRLCPSRFQPSAQRKSALRSTAGRQTTKAGYISRLEALRTVHGHRTVVGLSRERIITGILLP
jgi:hypothetical protein